MQLSHTQFNRLSQSTNQILQTNDLSSDYESAEKVLFNFNDLTSLSNGPEKLISSDSLHHNLDMLSNNETLFDTL